MSTDPTPMQFDNADYGRGSAAPSGVACAACKRSIVDQYYEAAAQVFCETCAAMLKAGPQGGSRISRTIEALLLGTMGGVIGAVIWFLIWKFTGYKFWLIAIVVGLLVGGGVRKGSRGRGGWFYQLMAIAITYASIAATNIPQFIEVMNQEAIKDHDNTIANAKKTARMALHKDGTIRMDDREVSVTEVQQELNQIKQDETTLLLYRQGRAEGMETMDAVNDLHDRMIALEIPMAYFHDSTFQTPLYFNFEEVGRTPGRRFLLLILAFCIALIVPFLSLPENFLGLIIIAIALWEAWKINKKPVLAITGPFVLSPSKGFGAGSVVHVPPSATPPPAFGGPPQGPTPS